MILEDAARLEALAAEVTVLRRSQQYGQSLAHRRQLVDALLTRARNAWASGAALSERLGEAQSSSPLFETALAKISEWRSALDQDLGQALTGDLFTGSRPPRTRRCVNSSGGPPARGSATPPRKCRTSQLKS